MLTHIPVVLAVARTRSFAKTAAELGLGASAVSHAVRTVEERLGSPLFARTTRSVALTEAGATFVESAERALQDLEGAVERLRARQGQVTGLLRINAPRVALFMGLTAILAEMTHRHPQLTVEVISDDALTDIVAAGFDAGIRLGEMIAQDMIAARLTAPCRAIMVAAPGYLEAHGVPTSIEDLVRHNCIGFRLLTSGAVYAWELRSGDKEVQLEVGGSVRVSDPTYARELARAGLGIAYVFEPLAADDLRAGRLAEVLPETAITEPGLFLYFARSAAKTLKMRAFLEVVRGSDRRPGRTDSAFAKTG